MKYYIVKVTNHENEQVECFAYTTKKESDFHIKSRRWMICPKHNLMIEGAQCDCKVYSTFLINEKLLDKKEIGNV